MKKLLERFGKLAVSAFFLMAIGVVVFLLTLPLYTYFGIDTDIIGLFIFTTGLSIFFISFIRRKNLRGFKLGVTLALAIVFSLPALSLIGSVFYFLLTGKGLGS